MSENFTSQTLLQLLYKVFIRVYKAVYIPLPHCPDFLAFSYTLPCLLCSSHTGCFAVPFAQSVLSTWNILLNSHKANSLTCFKSLLKYYPHEAHQSILFKLQTTLCLHLNPLALCFLFLQYLKLHTLLVYYSCCFVYLVGYLSLLKWKLHGDKDPCLVH